VRPIRASLKKLPNARKPGGNHLRLLLTRTETENRTWEEEPPVKDRKNPSPVHKLDANYLSKAQQTKDAFIKIGGHEREPT